MSNDAAFVKLQGAIDAFAALGRLPDELAAAAVVPLRQLLTANIAAQRAPSGVAWQPGAQGQPVLTGAAKALTVTSAGPTLTATLTGPEARHNSGAVKGKVKRQILPSRNSLGGVAKILQKIAAKKVAELQGLSVKL